MNYEKNIFIILILKKYFVKNFGSHYPVELVTVISDYYRDDKWIEHKFFSLEFGKKIYVDICRNGLGVDQIMFKFILPKGLEYKNFCVYDLIKCISVEINGCDILKFESEHLEMFDKIERNLKIEKNCSTEIDYLFDLTYFFKENTSPNHIIPTDFKGIRLIDSNQVVRCFIVLSDLECLVDDIINDNKDILLKLDAIANCHYVGISQMNDTNVIEQKNISVIQQIYTWNIHTEIFQFPSSHYEFRIGNGWQEIPKLFFYSKMLYKIKEIVPHFEDKINLIDDNIFVIDSNNVKDITLGVYLYETCHDFEISYMFVTENFGMYQNGVFGLRYTS